MTMRWTLTGLAAAIALGAFVATTGGAAVAQDKKVVLRIGSPLAADTFEARVAQRMSDTVKGKTKGQVDIQLFFGNQLGDHSTMMENIQMGALEMLNSFTPIWERVEPSFAAVNLPYVFTDIKHVRRVFDGPIGKQYEERLLKRNVRVLTNTPGAFRQVQTKRPVNGLGDMKGLKLRAVQATTFMDTFKLLGTDPVAISSKEVYMSLRSGLVEGLDAPMGVLLGWKMHEVAKYVAITNHMYNHGYFLINDGTFKRLTAEQQGIVSAGAHEASAWYYAEYARVEADVEAEFAKVGVTITRPDLAPFRKAVEPIYAKYGSSPEVSDILKKIKALEQ